MARATKKWERDEAFALALLIRDFHRKRRRLLKCRRAYNITADAIDLVFPAAPTTKVRGIRESARARHERLSS